MGRSEQAFAGVFARGEFRALFAGYAISTAGDQFARVAVSVLVFDRTRSAGWTALAYALTFAPDLVSGPLLSGLADRYPRRAVMIAADLVRAVLVSVMAVPGLPLGVVAGLLVAVQLANAPARAARGALLPAVASEELFPAGQAALSTAGQIAQVAGFAGGGALIAGLGTAGVLWADAATFAVSALLTGFGIRQRPASARVASVVRRGWWSDLAEAARLVWTTPRLRALTSFALLPGFYIAGEAVAVPYAAALGGAGLLAGLLLAAYALGSSAGMIALARLPGAVRARLMPVLAIGTCAPLLGCVFDPAPGWVVALFVVCGAASGHQMLASTTFTLSVPDDRRGQAFGLVTTVLNVAQSVGVGMAGVAANWLPPHLVVAGAGALGIVAGGAVAGAWWRAGPPAAATPRPAPATDPG